MNALQLGIIIAIFAYLVLAISTLFDKFLVTKTFKHPLSYAFWLGLLGLSAFLLLPFDFAVPQSLNEWMINLVAGAAFTLSILYYTRGLYTSDASIALPMVGSMSTILTGVLAFFLLGERLTSIEFVAIAILLGGFWILTTKKIGVEQEAIFYFVIAAVFFGISNVSMKLVLTTQPFISGLAFSRIGAAAVALLLLIFPTVRKAVIESKEVLTSKNILLTLFGNGLGAAGMIGVWLAYRFASPTVLNALQGVQYVFLALAAWLITHFWPKVISERIDARTLRRKAVGILVIIVGVVLLAGVA